MANGFERHFGYAQESERPDELNANGLDPDAVLMACRAAYPQFNPYAPHHNRLMNQKSIGSCQGCSLAHLTQIMVLQQYSQAMMFSGMQAYIMSQKVDRITGDRGSTLAGGQKVASTEGIVLERDWPYPNPARYSSRVPAGYENFGRVYIKSSKTITDVDLMWDLLASGAAIHLGVSWGRTFEQPVCDRYFGPVSGGHAVFLYGLEEGTDNTYLHNSWGPGFGDDGRVKVTKRFMQQVMRQRWTVAIAYQPLEIEIEGDILQPLGAA